MNLKCFYYVFTSCLFKTIHFEYEVFLEAKQNEKHRKMYCRVGSEQHESYLHEGPTRKENIISQHLSVSFREHYANAHLLKFFKDFYPFYTNDLK